MKNKTSVKGFKIGEAKSPAFDDHEMPDELGRRRGVGAAGRIRHLWHMDSTRRPAACRAIARPRQAGVWKGFNRAGAGRSKMFRCQPAFQSWKVGKVWKIRVLSLLQPPNLTLLLHRKGQLRGVHTLRRCPKPAAHKLVSLPF